VKGIHITYFLDTSAVYDFLHGDSRQQAQVRDLLVDGVTGYLPSFVRMEYLRSRIMTLIDLYFVIQAEETVSHGIREYAQAVAYQPRRILVVLDYVRGWLLGFEDANDKIKTLRRLGDNIVGMVFDIDDAFERLKGDGLACELGRVAMARESFNEQIMLNFYTEFRRIQNGSPTCGLCEFREKHLRALVRDGVDLCSRTQREKYKGNKGYVAQAERLERVPNIKDKAPKCSRCKTLGDSIIALQARRGMIILTSDGSFIPFGKILHKRVLKLKSGRQLKAANDSQVGQRSRANSP
jgi:predicted nucleic acid-binding protein